MGFKQLSQLRLAAENLLKQVISMKYSICYKRLIFYWSLIFHFHLIRLPFLFIRCCCSHVVTLGGICSLFMFCSQMVRFTSWKKVNNIEWLPSRSVLYCSIDLFGLWLGAGHLFWNAIHHFRYQLICFTIAFGVKLIFYCFSVPSNEGASFIVQLVFPFPTLKKIEVVEV